MSNIAPIEHEFIHIIKFNFFIIFNRTIKYLMLKKLGINHEK